jgi:tRNA threonylcarbamoyladenosine biosynthesis protein TsaB
VIVFALDTTTRPGSLAILADGVVVEAVTGDPSRTHAERLPGEILALVARHGLRLRDIELYGVAAGPGSFTGLRIGIAAVQGLALANDRRLVPVSALEAIAVAARGVHDRGLVAAWMDAQRGEVFAGLFGEALEAGNVVPIVDPWVATPTATLDVWLERVSGDTLQTCRFIGDGGMRFAELIRGRLGSAVSIAPAPALAETIGRLAEIRRDQAVHPAAIHPIYLRRPDAELARAPN